MKTLSLSNFSKVCGACIVGATFCLVQPATVMAAADDVEAMEEDINDPIEPVNRAIFFVNEALQTWFIRPASIFYQLMFPEPIRGGINNVVDNLGEPITFVNDVLQGEQDRATTTAKRFFVNSTYGILGIFDRATEMGIEEKHDEDLGQTFAVWGVGEGFYLVLPVFGPSNPRDAVGKFAQGYIDPVNYVTSDEVKYARMAFDGVDSYGNVVNELDQIKKTSIDYYAAVRSMYRQKRASEIRNGKPAELPPIPDLGADIDFGDDQQQASDMTTPVNPDGTASQ